MPLVLRLPLASSVRSCLALATVLTIASPSAAAQTPPFSLEVHGDFVRITNATPGGTVILATCARTSLSGRTHVAREAMALRDDDGDGAVQHTPASRIPPLSVWVAVDLASGAMAEAAHPGFPLTVTEIPPFSLKRNAEAAADLLDIDSRRLYIILVRPGSGAWTLFARDGAAEDDDRSANARLSIKFMDAQPVEGKANAPNHLKADDVVILIDPGHLDVSIARIQK